MFVFFSTMCFILYKSIAHIQFCIIAVLLQVNRSFLIETSCVEAKQSNKAFKCDVLKIKWLQRKHQGIFLSCPLAWIFMSTKI